MSKQLAVATAISVMAMAIFVLYGPGWAGHNAAVSSDVLALPDLSGFKTLFRF